MDETTSPHSPNEAAWAGRAEEGDLAGAVMGGRRQAASEALSKLTDSAGLHERLPMMDVIVDRLVRLLTTGLRQFTSHGARINVADYSIHRFGDVLQSLPERSLINVAVAEPWDNKLLITADSDMVYAFVDVLLGSPKSARMFDPSRSYTSIERRLAGRVLDLVADNLASAFEPISKVSFKSERLEVNQEFVVICRESNPTVMIDLQVDFECGGGKVRIALPYVTLEPVRKKLVQMFTSEKFGRDPAWERHFHSEVQRTELAITGVLHERIVTLGEVAGWKPGMTISLPISVRKPAARLMCNGVPLYEGEMGQSGGSLAIKVEEATNLEQEFIDALLSD
ncbi:FliM/FliN family flagellar motor switch protein [Tepidicaulis sp.]|uniref:FliM/FliN family flagellar motor switch protein n=1 Tax=Tepidicaulis sp. TaxID=1920809 RepID=UPI003B5C358F